MNTSETQVIEKPKRKSKQRVDRYSQNEAFAVMMLAFIVILLFHVSWRLNSIALISQLNSIAMVVTAGGSFLFFLLLGRWGYFHIVVSGFLAIFSTITFIGMGKAFIAIAFFSLILLFVAVPIMLGSLVAMSLYVLSRIANIENIERKLYRPMKVLTVLALPSALLIANSVTYGAAPFEYVDHIKINETNYYLYLDHGFLDPVQVELYECNHLSVACEVIYHTFDDFGPSFYFDTFRDTVEMDRGDDDNVLVILNGEVVFDSSEDRE